MLKKISYLLIPVIALFYLGLYWSFQPVASNWQARLDSPIKRFEGPGVMIGDRLYLFFGYREYRKKDHLLVATNDVSSYNAKTNQWPIHRGE